MLTDTKSEGATIFNVPSGVPVAIQSGKLDCSICGAQGLDFIYAATPTDEYKVIPNRGTANRRKFLVETGGLPCDCFDCVWLSDTELVQL